MDICLLIKAAVASLGTTDPLIFFTYLLLHCSLSLRSAIISKAPKSAFYGDPCFSGQFRGALVISLQPARNAPQQRRTQCLNRANAVWASSAGSGEPRGLFDISGEGSEGEIDIERAQWSGTRSSGYCRVDLSRNCNLESSRQVFSLSRANRPESAVELRFRLCRCPHRKWRE